MMRLMLIRCWPALIPIGIYLLWFAYCRRKAKRAGEPLPKLLDGPWLITACISVIILMMTLFAIPLLSEHNEGTDYQPKQLIDGELTEERLN